MSWASSKREARAELAATDTPPVELRPLPFFSDPDLICLALEAGRIGVWSWDIASKRAAWSTNIEEIFANAELSFDEITAVPENDIHPEDRAAVLNAMQEVLRTRTPRRVQYRLAPRGGADERWIETIATVAVEGGVPLKLVGLCREVTDRVKIHRELRIRASQQEALAKLGARALIETNLQAFLDGAVRAIGATLGVELVKILELVPGDAELLLRAGIGWKEGLVGSAVVSTERSSQAGFTLAAGGPVTVEDLGPETRFSGQGLLHQHGVVSGLTVPIAGRDGRAYGVLGAHTARRRRFTAYEVSFVAAVADMVAGAIRRHQSDERQELMIRELRHRSGNLFAQLLALFSQTARTSRTIAELVPKYEARVLALAHAHRLITESGWRSAALTDILNSLLAPYLDRFALAGPRVSLEPDPAFGLTAAVHELATNAAKHGSLSVRSGRVELRWKVQRTRQGLALLLDWQERDGPSPKRNARPGFGSKLIHTVIERQLGGEMQQSLEPQGLTAKLTIPLTHERWPGTKLREEAEGVRPD